MTVVIDWIGGNCPVQAQGTVDGFPFYFRARGEHWTMTISHSKDTPQEDLWSGSEHVWHYGEYYGTWPEAGWMEESEARALIDKAAALFRQGEQT
jgi:hypothetical protein